MPGSSGRTATQPAARPSTRARMQTAARAARTPPADRPLSAKSPGIPGPRPATAAYSSNSASDLGHGAAGRPLSRARCVITAPGASARARSARRRPSRPAAARRRPRSLDPAWTCTRCRRAARPEPSPRSVERRGIGDPVELAPGALDAEAAQHDHDQVRAQRCEPRVQELTRRVRAGLGADVHSAGRGDQVGHPVAGQVERRQPFDAEHPRARRRAPRAGGAPAAPQTGGELVSLGRRGRARGPPRGCLASRRPRCDQSARGRPGTGSDRLGQPVDGPVRHGADLAQVLGDHEVGREPAQRLGIDRMTGRARVAQPPHLGVDGRAGQRRVERRGR